MCRSIQAWDHIGTKSYPGISNRRQPGSDSLCVVRPQILPIADYSAEPTSGQLELHILFRDFLRTRINIGVLPRTPQPRVNPLSSDRQAPFLVVSTQRELSTEAASLQIGDLETLQGEIAAWSKDVNPCLRKVDWRMKIGDARRNLKSVYTITWS